MSRYKFLSLYNAQSAVSLNSRITKLQGQKFEICQVRLVKRTGSTNLDTGSTEFS